MNKDQLQKELLEKVKEGVKPSDLKKKRPDNLPDRKNPDELNKSDQIDQSIPTPPNQQIKNLQSQITSLKKQLQTYKDFKEADLKIKEKYKDEIKELKQELNDLQGEHKKELSDLFQQRKEHTPSWFFEFDSIIPVLHNEKPLAYALIAGAWTVYELTRAETCDQAFSDERTTEAGSAAS